MLYNKDWDKPKIKADPFSLESLIAWLEKMPADATYRYTCNGHCLLAQYFTAMGYEDVQAIPCGFSHGPKETFVRFSDEFENIAIGGFVLRPKLTFGAALTRAREALASRA